MDEREEKETLHQAASEDFEKRLAEMEKTATERARRLAEKINDRAAQLQAQEARLKAKNEELSALQKKIDVCEERMKNLDEAEQRLQSYQMVLKEREKKLAEASARDAQDYQQRCESLEQSFREKAEQQHQTRAAFEKQRGDLLAQENAVREKEQTLEAELNRKRQEADQGIIESKAQSMAEMKAWVAKQQAFLDQALEESYRQDEERRRAAQDKALQQFRESLEQERNEKLAMLTAELKEKEDAAASAREERSRELEEQAKQLQAKLDDIDSHEQEIEEREKNLHRENRRLERREKGIDERENNVDDLVQERYKSLIQQLQNEIRDKEAANQQLLNTLSNLQQENQELQSIKEGFDGDPISVMNKLNDLEKKNRDLRDQVQAMPSLEEKEELEQKRQQVTDLQTKVANLSSQREEMRDQISQTKQLERDYYDADRDRTMLKGQLEREKSRGDALEAELNRENQFRAQQTERDERIKSIEDAQNVQVDAPAISNPEAEVPALDELEWLNRIGTNCYNYGFRFPLRILYAFHTALKIADWSTITVLAGVSGTGKSELPHLYAAFGGLNFMAVPVQPNWDSQESMLGYFNSIDNRFDAQPLLRFLAKCSSLNDNMDRSLNIVLLDEMNLAHVEHYFAEFLSKLELRRDMGAGEEPCVDINIGAGMQPYQLKLTRNILWTGTMNQDETTKSLSDKVLDRGIVINFPRPKELVSRPGLKKLGDFVAERDIPMLDSRIWTEQWVKTQLPFDEEGPQQKYIDETYRKLIEDINDCLADAGRALGHRVWQSIEFYIANYPTVDAALKEAHGELTDRLKKAMHTAVEDQLVQKCMPKLRGIETRSNADCLDRIRRLLQDNGFHLDEDFRRACELGYGQFMWSSAEYINYDKKIAGAPEEEMSTTDEE